MKSILRPWRWNLVATLLCGIFFANVSVGQSWGRPYQPPFVSVQATYPLASEPGDNPGTFTVLRTGNTNTALTVAFSLGGTASNGVDYATVPISITLAAGQYSSNISIASISEPEATGYKTVELKLDHERGGLGAQTAYLTGPLNHALVYIVYNYTNVPPTVSIVGPTNGASYLSKPNILLAANASDSNGWVTSVEFLANGVSVGTVSNSPFSGFPIEPLVLHRMHGLVEPELPGYRLHKFQLVWTNVPPGDYSLQALATDNAGLQTTSATVDITVTTNLPAPEERIVYPVNNTKFPDQAPIHVYAAAGETDGVIDLVEFFANGNSIGTVTNYLAAEPMEHFPGFPPFHPIWLPFNLTWTNAPVGTNVLTAIATDNNGSTATSSPVNVIVTTNVYHHHPWW